MSFGQIISVLTINTLPRGGWETGDPSIIEIKDVRQGLSNSYPLQTKILDPLQTKSRKFSNIFTLKLVLHDVIFLATFLAMAFLDKLQVYCTV